MTDTAAIISLANVSKSFGKRDAAANFPSMCQRTHERSHGFQFLSSPSRSAKRSGTFASQSAAVRDLVCRNGPTFARPQLRVLRCADRFDQQPPGLLEHSYLAAPKLAVKPIGRCFGAAGVINSRIAESMALIASS